MNGNQLILVEEYEFDKPFFHKIDSIFESFIRGCHNIHFHTIEYKCVYDINLTNTGNIEIVNLRIADKSMNLYELKENLKLLDNKILYLIEKISKKQKLFKAIKYKHMSLFKITNTNKAKIFLRKKSRKPEYIKTFCNGSINPFHFACRRWALCNQTN